MKHTRHASPAPDRAAPTASARDEGAQLVGDLMTVMDALLATVEQETELVRNGRLVQAAALESTKTTLAGRYLASTARLKANAGPLSQSVPDMLDLLRQRHELFRALLQINLAVLATAHAVSEGLVRGAAGEVARRAAPQVYGASGRSVTPSPKAAPPVAVSKTL